MMVLLVVVLCFIGALPSLSESVNLAHPNAVVPHLPDLDILLIQRALPIGTCNAQTPCENAACCGGKNNNLCGYSPGECGAGNCTSNCDAKAECGQYGKPGQQKCPLNVCCSKFGFCGSTSEFCDAGCQSGFGGCGSVHRPSCNGNSIAKRTIGYYESWAATRKCQAVRPEDLNLNGFTHINFAFAFFDPSSFQMAPMDSSSGSLLGRFTALKDTHSGLQAWVSVGGWSFTDPGPTRSAFSDMTSSSGNRKKFINGLVSFMEHYGFDGVDLDWEYPQADDRGGLTADKANYVSLVKELRAAFVHGVWDAQSKFLGPNLAPHTNITEIDMGLDLLWRAGVEPGKVVLGLGWYGRSFTLTNPACNTPNGVCQFSGGAKAGPCSDASGILTLQEINDVISSKGVKPVWDKTAGVKWITWDSNQWISYDDDDTFDQKRKFANSRCLGGSMVWAIDQVNQKSDNGLAPAPGVTTQDQEDAKQKSDDLAAGITCYTTDCGQSCKRGTNEVAQVNGQPGKLSTNNRCKPNQYRSLCCDDGTKMGTCQWRGYRGVGLSCMGGCDDGETEVVQDTNSHDKKTGDRTCTGGLQSFCCKGFKPSSSGKSLKDNAIDAGEAAAISVGEQAALDIAAKAFCRIAVPALLAPLEALEALIPIVGEILDIAEIAATPALIQLCVKGVEKEGQAVFKVFGKKHTISFDKPTTTPKPRPPKSSHTPAKTSSACTRRKLKAKRDDCDPKTTVTIVTEVHDSFPQPPRAIVCDGAAAVGHPQACLNYHSISAHYADFRTLTCPFYRVDDKKRPVSASYTKQRDLARFLPQFTRLLAGGKCSPDEYPPAAICDFNDGYSKILSLRDDLKRNRPGYRDRGQRIRLIESADNSRAGSLFGGCNGVAHYDWDSTSSETKRGRRVDTIYHYVRANFQRQRFTMDFVNLQNLADDGLVDNICHPTINGVDHPGFAILNEDLWFVGHQQEAALTAGWAKGAAKRDWLDEVGRLVYVDANTTTPASREELRALFGFDECSDDTCSLELEALKAIVASMRENATPSAPIQVEAEATIVATNQESYGAPPSHPVPKIVIPDLAGETGRP
ncbi:hypothetical protein E8E14_013534 [Neopestalotiopsis sp. 37M]|nr:hypothetical protein E8E14_013534 [Neopestalotiopsis sp. 37M]